MDIQPKTIKWEVTPEEANYIIQCIRQRPHSECDELFKKLIAQANKPVELQVVEGGAAAQT